ncbi:MAG TPA: hypothetical protein VHP99_07285 [Pyrinomonadaceae bacterium]|nr:hypothetical protein [Pyrinomonadaceae bacterium]
MKTVALALLILFAVPACARQDQTPTPAQSVTFFDVLDLPARIDEPKLQKSEGDYDLKCALANRSGETLVGVRLTLMLVDSSNNRITRVTWNEATTVPAYSIKNFEFHPTLKAETKDAAIFLAIDEVIGRESVWRTVDGDKLLRAYARGQSGQIPKVQKLQNKYDKEAPRAIYNHLRPRQP